MKKRVFSTLFVLVIMMTICVPAFATDNRCDTNNQEKITVGGTVLRYEPHCEKLGRIQTKTMDVIYGGELRPCSHGYPTERRYYFKHYTVDTCSACGYYSEYNISYYWGPWVCDPN